MGRLTFLGGGLSSALWRGHTVSACSLTSLCSVVSSGAVGKNIGCKHRIFVEFHICIYGELLLSLVQRIPPTFFFTITGSWFNLPMVVGVGQTLSLHYYYLAFIVLTYLAYLIVVSTSYRSIMGITNPGIQALMSLRLVT
jgi:hypothetical protein